MSSLTERWSQSMMNNYGGPSIGLVSGSGAVLTDEDGKTYVDMLGGIAVNALGHAHPAVVQAVSQQVATLGHISNFYVAEPTVALAELLLALAGRPGKVIFSNSGAEANEAAFKLSRLTGRTQVVSTVGGFHGRTMGALALTGQAGKRDPFLPLPGDVTHVPYGDSEALRAAVTPQTAMVILEPIQGEMGVVVPPPGYLAAAREICTATGALLVLDEIQTGIGRTGHWFHHQSEGVEPDVVTLAKGLGGGLPLGATLAFGAAADLFTPGSHGSTFAGNPISCAAGLAVIRTIAGEGLLDHVKRIGELIRRGLEGLPGVTGVRGAGLLLGIQLDQEISKELAARLKAAGFLVNPVQPDVIRLAPPLILSTEQAESFVAAFREALP
ncbi:acetylornithine transaminase [Actinoplanes sp. NPDC051494]|uniref:acetylornithine transaminase n=1 Tax=Actinoplanes sp. NPDC051494 TaxID=3363907 RepID=UPI00378A579B